MSVFILAPDPNGTCCGCETRLNPCDSCGTGLTCGLSFGTFGNLVDAQSFRDDIISKGSNCYVYSSESYGGCDALVAGHCTLTPSTCHTTDAGMITSYNSGTLLTANASTSNTDNCASNSHAFLVFTCFVASGTQIDLNVAATASASQTGLPIDPSALAFNVLARMDYGDVVLNSTLLPYSQGTSYHVSQDSCFNFTAAVDAALDNRFGGLPYGPKTVSTTLSISMVFDRPFVAQPIGFMYTDVSGNLQTLSCN